MVYLLQKTDAPTAVGHYANFMQRYPNLEKLRSASQSELSKFFAPLGLHFRDPMLWEAAERVAPETETGRWNLTLIDFGAAVCKAKNPGCPNYPLRHQCNYFLEDIK